ncbi:MAG TPA: glucokinase [Lysobacter sp.]|nr:glucokinase [Lysobacter sp.]
MATATTQLALVADIGGTRSRYALTDPADPRPRLLHPRSVPNAGFASLQASAGAYLADVGLRPLRAMFAVAAPMTADLIQLTNHAWSFSRAELQQALGLTELRLLNDFAAVAWAVPALRAKDRVSLHGRDDAELQGPVSVLGPGTGLGVAQLVGSRVRGWQVIDTEGGHAAFAPIGAQERAIVAWLEAQLGRVSNERVLSGAGLARIDAAVRGATDPTASMPVALREPAAILRAALKQQEPDACCALRRFCAVLGSVAGDIALIHGARSVVIAGGIVPRFIPLLRNSAFRERFLAKGRLADRLATITIQIVTHPAPGLLGAAVALRATDGRSESGSDQGRS